MLTWFKRAPSLVQPSGADGSSFSRTAGETSSLFVVEYAAGETTAAMRNTSMAVVRVFIVPPLTGSNTRPVMGVGPTPLITAKLVPAGQLRSMVGTAWNVKELRGFPLPRA